MDKQKTILALSDSHGNKEMVKQAIERTPFVDYIFHLGDVVGDALYIQTLTDTPLYYVRGNCDYGSLAETKQIVTVLGKRFFLAHGHEYGVKYSLNRLVYAGMEEKCDAVIFGHTHQSLAEAENGIMLINPGCLSHSRGGRFSYALISVGEHGIIPKIVDL